jgi:hypothetical protein
MIAINLVPKQPRGLKQIEPDMLDFSEQEMLQLAGQAIQVLNEQVSQGLGANGRPMRSLSRKYRAKKIAKGQPGIRNLEFSGAMLRSLAPGGATTNSIYIGFANDSQNAKAVANENRANWFGLSKLNEEKVDRLADRLLRNKTR